MENVTGCGEHLLISATTTKKSTRAAGEEQNLLGRDEMMAPIYNREVATNVPISHSRSSHSH